MATHFAHTATSRTAQVTDIDAVEALFEEYQIPLNYDLADGELVVWGTNYLSVRRETDSGDTVHDCEPEFLYRLSKYIAEGEQLDLRTVGNTKCRSVTAIRWVIKPGVVRLGGFERSLEIVSPPHDNEYFRAQWDDTPPTPTAD